MPAAQTASSAKPVRFDGTDTYVATDDLKLAVNAALTLQRPLLIKGEPGTGKSWLSEHLAGAGEEADALGRRAQTTDSDLAACLELGDGLVSWSEPGTIAWAPVDGVQYTDQPLVKWTKRPTLSGVVTTSLFGSPMGLSKPPMAAHLAPIAPVRA